MKKATSNKTRAAEADMRAEYDFSGGVRGKHYETMRAGYTVTIHRPNGTTSVKSVVPRSDAVFLEPDVQAHFPDSESVNKALRCLIPLLPKKHRTKTKHQRQRE